MSRVRRVISAGKDHTDMFPIFRSLVLDSGAREGDLLIWAGCPGPCYAMATFFSFSLRDLGLNLYFAVDADINKSWRLEFQKDLGFVATKKENPIKAKIMILMSGLVTVPFENVMRLASDNLAPDGIIIGETVIPGLFENVKWHDQIPFRFVFEFSMERPTAFEIIDIPG
jgi:hypothetical protein